MTQKNLKQTYTAKLMTTYGSKFNFKYQEFGFISDLYLSVIFQRTIYFRLVLKV